MTLGMAVRCDVDQEATHPTSPAPTPPKTTVMANRHAMANVKTVVVVGGGVIGCNVAYYLAQRGVDVVLVEATAIASAASGKAGACCCRPSLASPIPTHPQKCVCVCVWVCAYGCVCVWVVFRRLPGVRLVRWAGSRVAGPPQL
jgi:hypothetical protein